MNAIYRCCDDGVSLPKPLNNCACIIRFLHGGLEVAILFYWLAIHLSWLSAVPGVALSDWSEPRHVRKYGRM